MWSVGDCPDFCLYAGVVGGGAGIAREVTLRVAAILRHLGHVAVVKAVARLPHSEALAKSVRYCGEIFVAIRRNEA